MEIKYLYNSKSDSYEVVHIDSYEKTIIIPEKYNNKNVTRITSEALKDCFSVEEILLPHTIKNIDEGAFYPCINLMTTFFYGKEINLDNIKIERGNGNLLISNIVIFDGEAIINDVFNEWFKDKTPLSLCYEDVFPFESIHYLRAAISRWALEKGLKGDWYYCDKLDIDEDTAPFFTNKEYDFIVLDSVDLENDEEYIRYMHNAIYRSIVDEVPIIGLFKDKNSNCSLFLKHKNLFDERLKKLNSNLELKEALEILSKSNRVGISTLQREMSIGFNKAKRIFDTLIELGFIKEINGKYEYAKCD